MNAVGDADLCDVALTRAEELLARSTAPAINHPIRVKDTGRAANASRLAAIPGVISPAIDVRSRAAILAADDLRFPLLLRSPGLSYRAAFRLCGDPRGVAGGAGTVGRRRIARDSYLDARGPDGMARKYRVMFVDGVAYPLHLAISADWKVHYFTAGMADNASFREEKSAYSSKTCRPCSAHAP